MKSPSCFRILATCVVLWLASGLATAQEFPTRPVRIIVPTTAGGVFDIVARVLADKISADWGKPIIIELRPGADGNIGMEAAAKSAPDGYTWLFTGPALLSNTLIHANLRWDGLRDFLPVGVPMIGQTIAVVPAALPVKTPKEFAAYASARPGQLNFGNSGTGSTLHLSSEMFFKLTGIKLVDVGYKGQPPVILGLLSGQVDFALLTFGLALPHIKSGKLTPLAMFMPNRAATLPDVPTVAEAGYPAITLVSRFGV